jgi:acyl-CoA dehydrogenase
VSFPLTPEQSMLVDSIRAFVERELCPHEDLVERLDELPDDLARDIQAKALKAGFYAANMPAELGGGGLDALSLTLMERELGRTGYALQTCVWRPSNILQACEGEQIERYLIPTIKGERHDCLAMTEPGAGSDVRSMKTRATRKGDGYVINGAKHFISHADKADYVILFVATGIEEGASARGRRSRLSWWISARPASPCGAGRHASPIGATINTNCSSTTASFTTASCSASREAAWI